MSGAQSSVGLVLGTLFLVSLIAALVSAMALCTPGATARPGSGRSVLVGLIATACGVFGLLFVLNPDPVDYPERLEDYAGRTLVSAGFCAVFWLPIFLSVRSVLMRRRA